MTPCHPLSLLTLLVVASLSVPALAQDPEAPRRTRKLRTLVVEIDSASAGSLTRRLPKAGAFETRSVNGLEIDEGDTDWAQSVVITDVGKDAEKAATVIRHLRARNLGVVIAGDAAFAFPDSIEYSELLGRSTATGKEVLRVQGEFVVEVLDQRHNVTQSLTHFVHKGSIPVFKTKRTAYRLAQGFSEATDVRPEIIAPVLWTADGSASVFRRSPRVLVLGLDHVKGPSADLVTALIGRGLEATAARHVTTKLQGKYVLAAERLGPEQHGVRKGLPPRLGFYRGRQVSQVMSYLGADWLIRPDRVKTEQPDKVIEAIGIRPGQTIVDLGCGNGYFSLRMAKKVGETGEILCVDIQKEMLELLQRRAAKEGITNAKPILATETDPKLPTDGVDLVLMVDVYHELSKPVPVMKALFKAVKKGGRVVLVEYRGEDPTVMIKPLHRTTVKQMRAELEAFGFRFVENKSFLPYQHILIFETTKSAEPPLPKKLDERL